MPDLSLQTAVRRLRTIIAFLANRERIPAYTAMAAGMVAVRGLPPMEEELSMMAGFAVLFRLLVKTTPRRGAWLAFLFGLAHFTVGFSWLLTSIHTYGGFPYVIAVIALLIFSAAMAIYPAIFGALFHILAPRPELIPLAAPPLWVVTEWLRVRLFTGFAWNLVGYGWNSHDAVLQVADLGGIYLMSWLMLFPAAVMVLLWMRRDEARIWFLGIGSLILVLGLAAIYGYVRMDSSPDSQTRWASPLRVALVQGNIPQDQKWSSRYRGDNFNRYLNLSRSIDTQVDLVVWPETAVAFFLQAAPKAMGHINKLSHHLGAPILTGAPMADKNDDGSWDFYNSAVMLDESDNLDQRYNKHHLVPFGEYVPFRGYIPDSITKLTAGTSDFSSGPGATPLRWNQGDIGVLICYEVIFPEEVRRLATTGVRWLVNLTNDGWFGESAKPQHLAMTRMRAIENRLPLVRVANTGISAAFDQFGKELGRIPPNEAGVLTVKLPRGSGQSLFRKAGHVWIWFWLYLCTAAWLTSLWRGSFFSRIKEKFMSG